MTVFKQYQRQSKNKNQQYYLKSFVSLGLNIHYTLQRGILFKREIKHWIYRNWKKELVAFIHPHAVTRKFQCVYRPVRRKNISEHFLLSNIPNNWFIILSKKGFVITPPPNIFMKFWIFSYTKPTFLSWKSLENRWIRVFFFRLIRYAACTVYTEI